MTALFCITHDPFAEWKPAQRVWREARDRGLSVFVALDDRATVEETLRVESLADTVRLWHSEGHCEDAYAIVPEIPDEWVLLVSDDEEPSDLCWRLSLEPPYRARFGIPVIPVLGKKMWKPDVGVQERLFPRDQWAWEGGFEGHSVSPYKKAVIATNPGVIIWHRYPESPRAEREEKAARYEALAPGGEHRRRLIWEDHPEDLAEMPEHVAKHLPRRYMTN